MRRTAFQPTIRSFSASQQSCAAAPQLRLRSRLLALADGWRSPFPVKFVSRQDAPFLIKEVVEDRWYLRRGVELQPGDCVLDVRGQQASSLLAALHYRRGMLSGNTSAGVWWSRLEPTLAFLLSRLQS